MEHERLIFHVDVNSAFLSWEAVRRVKEGLPDLREIPFCDWRRSQDPDRDCGSQINSCQKIWGTYRGACRDGSQKMS